MKMLKKVLPIILTVLAFIGVIDVKAYSISYSAFKPLSNSETVVGYTDIGYWNDGAFFETVTYEILGYDAKAGKQIVRFRYYIIQEGNNGSYAYQSIPVGIYVDGSEIGRFTSQIGSIIHNETRFCGEQTVTLYSGSHIVELKDIGTNADTVVNMKKPLYINKPQFVVSFKDWNGTLLKNQNVFKDSNATPPSNPSRTGYIFTGWDKSYTNVQSDLTVTAQYRINTYTVNFRDWNGTILKSQIVNYGSSASPPSNPSRTGYTFTGWNGGYSSVNSNRDIYATYTINYYTAFTNHWVEKDFTTGAWNPSGTLNGGGTMIHQGTSNHQSIAYGGSYTPSPVSTTGYELSSNTFGYNAVDGWSGGTNGSSISIYQYTSVEFYYRKKTYQVSYNSNGGSAVSNQSIKYKNTASSPSPTKENFKLVGWYTDSGLTNKFDFNTQITSNVTLYAKWERTHYDINISHRSYDTVNGWKTISNEKQKLAVNSSYTVNNLSANKIPVGYMVENKYDLYTGNSKLKEGIALSTKATINGTFDTFIVRYVSTSATMTGKETFHFVNDNVPSTTLVKRANATDIKDGDLSSIIKVDKIKYPNRTETGQGKSTFVRYLINSLLSANIPIWMIDGKMVDYNNCYKVFERYYAYNGVNVDDILNAVKRYRIAMYERLKEMQLKGMINYTENAEWKPIFLIFDEQQMFSDSLDKKTKQAFFDDLGVVLRLGRAVGFFYVAVTQTAHADSFPTTLRDNCQLKIVLGKASNTAYQMCFGSSDIMPLKKGQAWFSLGTDLFVVSIPDCKAIESEYLMAKNDKSKAEDKTIA